MYDLNNAQDVIRQMRDANLADYQIVKVLREALDELTFKKVDLRSTDDAREHAIEFQAWTAENAMSYADLADWQKYFEGIGIRFNLTEEFKENGIL